MLEDAVITHESGEHWLDLRYIHHTRQFGDLTLLFTWDWGGDVPQAVMCIVPSAWDRGNGQPPIVMIRRDDAWRWSRTHNNDRQMIGNRFFGRPPSSDAWQMATAIYFATLLRLNGVDVRVTNRIRGMIEDHLDDLLSLPPAPIRQGLAEADVAITDTDTGKTINAVLRDA